MLESLLALSNEKEFVEKAYGVFLGRQPDGEGTAQLDCLS